MCNNYIYILFQHRFTLVKEWQSYPMDYFNKYEKHFLKQVDYFIIKLKYENKFYKSILDFHKKNEDNNINEVVVSEPKKTNDSKRNNKLDAIRQKFGDIRIV